MTFMTFLDWFEQVNAGGGGRQPGRTEATIEVSTTTDVRDGPVEQERSWCHVPLSRLSILYGVH